MVVAFTSDCAPASLWRDELLNGGLFTGLKKAKVVTEDHRLECNHAGRTAAWGTGPWRRLRPRVGRAALRNGCAPPIRLDETSSTLIAARK
jgi:hypothetical protein